jgi:hypothetical protein
MSYEEEDTSALRAACSAAMAWSLSSKAFCIRMMELAASCSQCFRVVCSCACMCSARYLACKAPLVSASDVCMYGLGFRL